MDLTAGGHLLTMKGLWDGSHMQTVVALKHRRSLSSSWLCSGHATSLRTSFTTEKTNLELFKAPAIWLFNFMQQNLIRIDLIILISTPWNRHAQHSPNVSMLLHVSQSPLQLGWGSVSNFDQWALSRNDMCHFCMVPSPALSSLLQYHWKPHDKTGGGNGIPKSLDVDEFPLTCLWERLWVSEKLTWFVRSLRFQSLLP